MSENFKYFLVIFHYNKQQYNHCYTGHKYNNITIVIWDINKTIDNILQLIINIPFPYIYVN